MDVVNEQSGTFFGSIRSNPAWFREWLAEILRHSAVMGQAVILETKQ